MDCSTRPFGSLNNASSWPASSTRPAHLPEGLLDGRIFVTLQRPSLRLLSAATRTSA